MSYEETMRQLEIDNAAYPPTKGQPGDRWGPYILGEDGWWRLVPLKPVKQNEERTHG